MSDRATVTLRVSHDEVSPVLGELTAAREAGLLWVQAARSLSELATRPDEFIAISIDDAAATGAGDLPVRLEMTDRLRTLLAEWRQWRDYFRFDAGASTDKPRDGDR